MVRKTTIIVKPMPTVDVKIDNRIVKISVSPETKTDFKNQFVRTAPSALQKRKFKTVMALMCAAYKAGQASN
jgi:hypothetical protein